MDADLTEESASNGLCLECQDSLPEGHAPRSTSAPGPRSAPAWCPSAKHLCSWAKVSPGNNESAGKRKSGRTGKGNKWLRAILVACAHAAGHTKETYLGTKFRRFASRKGKKPAAIMVAHVSPQ
jgi:transposase